MGAEEAVLSSLAAMANRPRLTNALFKFSKWGNPFGDERFSWPYPMFERMQATGYMSYSRSYRQWFVMGYDEMQQVLRSPDTASSGAADLLLGTKRYKQLSPLARRSFARWLLTSDPPDHTRMRSAVSRAFTPKQIAGYAPLVDKVTRELLNDLPATGQIDIVADFTDKMPIHIIAEILGLPHDKREWLHAASREIAGIIDPLTPFDPQTMSARFAELDEYFVSLIAQRRREPSTDLISALASATDGPTLDDDEIIAMISLILTAGHETVTGLLGNALIALAQNPDQRQLLRTTPELIDNAVEELLRYDSSAQVTGRQATADIRIGNQTIKKGANIGLFAGAANRDKRRWPDADKLRLDRESPNPMSFGFGAHHCLGAAVARMEMRTALPPLLDHLGDYTVDLSRVAWKRSFALRGPVLLPLRMAAES